MKNTNPTDIKLILSKWDGKTYIKPDIKNNIYLIKSPENLAWIGEQKTAIDKNIKFINSVDMNDKPFNGIAEYKGTIDGNHKIIKNINIDNSDNLESYAGLINRVNGNTTIKNLGLENSSIKGSSINEESFSGGLIGIVTKNSNVIIKNSYNTGDVSSTSTSYTYTGGLIGIVVTNAGVTIKNSYNIGDVSSTSISTSTSISISVSGGLLGCVYGTATIKNSFNYGSIEGITMGGIVGIGQKTTSVNNYWYSSSEGIINNIGGTKLTENGLKQSNNFKGFDFVNVWNKPESTDKPYPTLKENNSIK